MAKNSKNNKVETAEVLETENTEVVEVAETKEVTTEKKSKKDNKKSKKPAKNSATTQKRSRAKETIGELKKVTWPSFGKTMKQTGMVLSLVLIFGVVVLGIDLLISFIINFLSSF